MMAYDGWWTKMVTVGIVGIVVGIVRIVRIVEGATKGPLCQIR